MPPTQITTIMWVDHSIMTPPAHRLQQSCKWTTLSWLHLHIDCSRHMTHEWTTLSWLHLHTDHSSHHVSGPLCHDSTCIQIAAIMRVDHSIMTPPAYRPQVSYEWTTLSWLHLHTDHRFHMSGPLYYASTCTQIEAIMRVDHSIMTPTAHLSLTYHVTLSWICQRSTIMVVINILSTILMQLHEIINLIQNKPFSYHFQVIYISPHPQAIFFVPTEAEWWEWWLWPLTMGHERKKPVLCICGFGEGEVGGGGGDCKYACSWVFCFVFLPMSWGCR